MNKLNEKKIIITTGGTLEKWDNVRGHTNLAKGSIGCFLAEEALRQGAEVIYLHGYFASLPQNTDRMLVQQFEGISDLSEKIKFFLENEKVSAVIMAAAVSDWIIDKIVDHQGRIIENSGKIPSENPPVIHFKTAPKIIDEIKKWKQEVILAGFKLEHTTEIDYLINRAKQRMETWQADLVVANQTGSLYSNETTHYIVSKDGNVERCDSKALTACTLIEKISHLIPE